MATRIKNVLIPSESENSKIRSRMNLPTKKMTAIPATPNITPPAIVHMVMSSFPLLSTLSRPKSRGISC